MDLIKLLSRPLGDGNTVQEIAATTGMSAGWVRIQLTALMREGRLIVGRKHGFDITGKRATIPCYSIRRLTEHAESDDKRGKRGKRTAGKRGGPAPSTGKRPSSRDVG